MADFSLFYVVEGLLVSSHYLPPWKNLGKFLNCDDLGNADVGKWRLGCWVLQGIGYFMRRNDDIF